MSMFSFLFRRKPKPPSLIGGNGESFDTAVVINVSDNVAGVAAEYDYVAGRCGVRGRDWNLQMQSLKHHGGKAFDVLAIVLRDGQVRTFYFDISNFFSK